MTDEELEKAADEWVSENEPKYPDISWETCDEKMTDAFMAGAKWMLRQGITLKCLIDYKTGEMYGLDKDRLHEFAKEIQASAVNVQITKR